MTITRPCRRMIRHLLQIFLTLGLTFTACVSSWAARAARLLWPLAYLYRYTIRPRLRS